MPPSRVLRKGLSAFENELRKDNEQAKLSLAKNFTKQQEIFERIQENQVLMDADAEDRYRDPRGALRFVRTKSGDLVAELVESDQANLMTEQYTLKYEEAELTRNYEEKQLFLGILEEHGELTDDLMSAYQQLKEKSPKIDHTYDDEQCCR